VFQHEALALQVTLALYSTPSSAHSRAAHSSTSTQYVPSVSDSPAVASTIVVLQSWISRFCSGVTYLQRVDCRSGAAYT